MGIRWILPRNEGMLFAVSYTHLDVYKRQVLNYRFDSFDPLTPLVSERLCSDKEICFFKTSQPAGLLEKND